MIIEINYETVDVVHIEALTADRMPERDEHGKLWRTYDCEGTIALAADGRVFYTGYETPSGEWWEL